MQNKESVKFIMKVIAINGSPRKNWNTAIMLQSALEGAKSGGAETELINLYDYEYKGCVSCFSCKRKGSKTDGLCAYKDALTPILEKCKEADAVIHGNVYVPEDLETIIL